MTFDVVMLTSAHPALDDRIFYREAKTLVEAGYSVCVVGQHPRSGMVDGIFVLALDHPSSRLRRFLAGVTIFKISLQHKARLYIIHDPELIAIALLLRLTGRNVVYDAHENLPAQLLQKDWIHPILRRALRPVLATAEWLASRVLNGVIAAVPAIRSRFSPSRTVLVRNFPTRAALAALQSGPALSRRANIVIYTGGLSRLRGTRELVEAMRGIETAKLWLVGQFDDPEFQRTILDTLPDNTVWLGWKPHLEVLEMYRMAKLGVVVLHPTPNHRCALPVKLFEYLGAGLPVIASNFPEYAELVQGCGVQVDPLNVEEIRNSIRHLLADPALLQEMSARARQHVNANFSWQQEGARLVEFCARHMSPPAGATANGTTPQSGLSEGSVHGLARRPS
jgi:glycosyltransferase involved in cell wall biosynthesis